MIHVHEYWELNNIIGFENSFHPQRIRQQIKNKFMKQQWEKSNWIVYFFLTHIFGEATASKAQFNTSSKHIFRWNSENVGSKPSSLSSWISPLFKVDWTFLGCSSVSWSPCSTVLQRTSPFCTGTLWCWKDFKTSGISLDVLEFKNSNPSNVKKRVLQWSLQAWRFFCHWKIKDSKHC